MNTITKRILSLVLSFVMLIGMVPVSALAEDNVEGMLTDSAYEAAVGEGTDDSSPVTYDAG